MVIRRVQDAIRKRQNLLTLGVYGGVSAIQRAVGFVLTFFFTHFMPPSDVGIYSVVTGLALIFDIIADCGLSSAVLRTYYDVNRDPALARQYLSELLTGARLVSLAVLTAILLICVVAWGTITANAIPMWPYLPLTIASAVFLRQSVMLASVCRVMGLRRYFFAGQVTQIAGTLVFAVILVVGFKLGALGAVCAYLTGLVVGALTFSFLLARYVGIRIRPPSLEKLKEGLHYGIPLALHQLGGWGRQTALRVLLLQLVTLTEVGIFSLASQLAFVLLALTDPLNVAFAPYYNKRRAENDESVKTVANKLIAVMLALLAPLCIAWILYMAEFVHLVFPPKYAGATAVAAVLIISAFLQIQLNTFARQFGMMKKTVFIPFISTVPTLLGLVLAFVVEPILGLAGAAAALALGNTLSLVTGYAILSRFEKPDHPVAASIVTTGLMIGAAVLAGHGLGRFGAFDYSLIRAGYLLFSAAICGAFWILPNGRWLRGVLSR